MRQLTLLALALSGLTFAAPPAPDVRSQIEALRAQVETLSRRVSDLGARAAAVRDQLGQLQLGRDMAYDVAAQAYLRSCVVALELSRVDHPQSGLPAALNGAGCDSPALGEDRVKLPEGVRSASIDLLPGGLEYGVTVQALTGHVFKFEKGQVTRLK